MYIRTLVILTVVLLFTSVETGAQQTSNEKSKKVYGVRDLVHILNTKPNSLKGKTVRVEVFSVDGTRGMGSEGTSFGAFYRTQDDESKTGGT